MHFGASMFFTDYSMTSAELAREREARGFESVWAAEHSHIPLSRKSPWGGGGELPKQYYDVMDPFVSLTAAAMATKTLKIGTGVCLVKLRDPIQTAKLVASIDQVSAGRFLFGIGNGWQQLADKPYRRHQNRQQKTGHRPVFCLENAVERRQNNEG